MAEQRTGLIEFRRVVFDAWYKGGATTTYDRMRLVAAALKLTQ